MISPISPSPFAEIVPTCAISSSDLNALGRPFDEADRSADGLVDSTLQIHRIHTRGHRLHTFAYDGLGENGCRRGPVAGFVTRAARDFAQHLRTHVLEFILELDLLGDGHAVLGDTRGAERLIEDDVTALRAERYLDGVS